MATLVGFNRGRGADKRVCSRVIGVRAPLPPLPAIFSDNRHKTLTASQQQRLCPDITINTSYSICELHDFRYSQE